MFGKVFGASLELVWRLEWRTPFIGSLGGKFILAPPDMPK